MRRSCLRFHCSFFELVILLLEKTKIRLVGFECFCIEEIATGSGCCHRGNDDEPFRRLKTYSSFLAIQSTEFAAALRARNNSGKFIAAIFACRRFTCIPLALGVPTRRAVSRVVALLVAIPTGHFFKTWLHTVAAHSIVCCALAPRFLDRTRVHDHLCKLETYCAYSKEILLNII